MKNKKQLKEIAKKIAALELAAQADPDSSKSVMISIEGLISEIEEDPEQLVIVDELVQKILEKNKK